MRCFASTSCRGGWYDCVTRCSSLLHQHTAPAFNSDVLKLKLGENNPRRVATEKYWKQTVAAISAAVKQAMGNLKPLTHLGTSRAKVERVASNRRIEQEDGSIRMRSSRIQDPALQALLLRG